MAKAEIRVMVVGHYTVIQAGDKTHRIDHRLPSNPVVVSVEDYQDDGDSPSATKPDKPWVPMLPAVLKKGAQSHLAKTLRSDEHDMEVFKNDLYTVIRTKLKAIEEDEESETNPTLIHLSIRRNDRSPSRDWRHFQKIKNELVGKNAEGVELFPSEDRLIDTANQYHLWCLPPGHNFNFGWFDGRLTASKMPMGAQRPFVDGEKETVDEIRAKIRDAQQKAGLSDEDDLGFPPEATAPASPQEDE